MAVENWASIRGRRVRIVAELHCPVCEGDRVVGLVAVAGFAVPTPCPHCAVGELGIPIRPQHLNQNRTA